MNLDRVLPWVLRAAWAVLPFTAGPALAAALDPKSLSVRTLCSALFWGGWLLGLVAGLVAHPVSLTALRVLAPAGAALSLAARVLDDEGSVLALGWWVVVLALAFAPETGIAMVNGPAYPNERRFPLRPPGPLLLGPLPLAWATALAVPFAGTVLLATGRWVPGGVLLVVGLALAAILLRAIHGLSRRWVVFVPAGFVIHDAQAFLDPVLFRREDVEALQVAPADSDSLDLTKGALGTALELVLVEKVPVTLTKPGTRGGEQGRLGRLLFTPTRPGAVLAEAAARRLPVQAAGPPPSTSSPS